MRISLALSVVLVLNMPGAPAGEKPKSAVSADEKRIFELTNQERKKKDAAPLALSPLLCKLARAHSENMARQMRMEHTLDNKSPFDRMRDAGYKFANAGENIGTGSDNAPVTLVMQAWMESEGHRANILNTQFTEIGVRIARDKAGVIYYTQVFGRPQK